MLLYPETGETAARWMEKNLGQPFTRTMPIGVGATRAFIDEVNGLTGVIAAADDSHLRMPWWSQSVDSNYLTGKRVLSLATAHTPSPPPASQKMRWVLMVCGIGCFNREMARPVRVAASELGLTALITDDYLEVEEAISEASRK